MKPIQNEVSIRRRLTVTGVVQGVGFRPFVYNLATRLGLSGFVGNDSHGLFIEVEGIEERLDAFRHELTTAPPPLAHIEHVTVTAIPAQDTPGFVIALSQAQSAANTLISPDLSLCADCLAELFDPTNRRYRYPFINCTNCGPRFTITRDIPYDRSFTTMAHFPLCADCQAEYDTPRDRRFHAQPNACPICGPQVEFRRLGEGEKKEEIEDWETGEAAIGVAQRILAAGEIVAVKGIGGFHLACDATNDYALQALRTRKGRVDKPFALMVADVATAHTLAHVSVDESSLLESRARPIVLLRKRSDSPLSPLVAPGNRYVGIMLAYTPIHHLLFRPSQSVGAHSPILVMTSANVASEPIVKDNDEALDKLKGLADAILLHNRAIHVHCDDSVVRICNGHELPIRRSRGYTPFPVKLPVTIPSVLAVGGELKSTFCLTKEQHAFMSQHIGDMENLETLHAFARAVAHFQAIFRVEPEMIACDLHPRYLSTRWANEYAHEQGKAVMPVQHHHAHIAGLMAEHGLDGSEPVIGISFDGTGYGTDGAIWGGEVLVADYWRFERAAHLRYVPLPGGDSAVKRPYRTALAWLWAAGAEWNPALPPVAACPITERNVIRHQLETGLNSVSSSSMGRLFDAVAALAGVRQTVTYEAQAAIEFESFVEDVPIRGKIDNGYRFEFTQPSPTEPLIFDAAPVIRGVIADVLSGAPISLLAAKFHDAVAELIVDLCLSVRGQNSLNQVALSGGVFQNIVLLQMAVARLQEHRFHVLVHRHVPPNDGGLALGQAMIVGCSR